MRCPDCGARRRGSRFASPAPMAFAVVGGVQSCRRRFTTFERAQVAPDKLAARVAARALDLADHDYQAVGIQ